MSALQLLARRVGGRRRRLYCEEQRRWWARPNSSRGKSPLRMTPLAGGDERKSEWWAVDGEMHEIGDHVPPRERFVIPRDNLPNKRRKQLREQFMRRTRLVLRDTEQESWCKRYMELYQELRENWERLYWDEGYSKKIASEHATYESAEDDDQDFSPYRRKETRPGQDKDHGPHGNRAAGSWSLVGQMRDKFEHDRERRMREKAFAPMRGREYGDPARLENRRGPLDAEKFFP
ncbi:uncharacterized protein LOC144705317 [Wolffia australiana]